MLKSFAQQNKSNVSGWHDKKPVNKRPNLSAVVELPASLVNQIVAHGEIPEGFMIQLRVALWDQKRDHENQPNMRGKVQFTTDQEKMLKKSA